MAKVISLQKMKQAMAKRKESEAEVQGTEDEITRIINDCSLTPAHRHWKLENLLMNMDDQLEQYKKDLEIAERTLDTLVAAAENDILQAYDEFETRVRVLTRAVQKLTGTPARREEGGEVK